MGTAKFSDFNTLSFDVVGTLIDFERGILDWFAPLLAAHGQARGDAQILTAPDTRWQRSP